MMKNIYASNKINLVVGDLFKLKGDMVAAAAKAVELIKWFNNHSVALGLLRLEQKQTYKKHLALMLPVITRWTAYYLACSRLLETEAALRACVLKRESLLVEAGGAKREQKEKAESILAIAKDPEFWVTLAKYARVCWDLPIPPLISSLIRLKILLEPLAIATNVTQASNTRLDHVLISLAQLYKTYTEADARWVDEATRRCLLSSLERRWAKADQTPFILAVFFNPFIRGRLFGSSTPLGTAAGIYGVVKEVWGRVFPDIEKGIELWEACIDYANGVNEFSDDAMNLAEIAGYYAKEVRFSLIDIVNLSL
jgi:hypothetical protein